MSLGAVKNCNISLTEEHSMRTLEKIAIKPELTIDADHVLCYAQLQLSLTIGLSCGVPVMVMEHKGLFYYSDNVDCIGKAACLDRNLTYGHSWRTTEDVVYHLPSMQTMLATIKEEG